MNLKKISGIIITFAFLSLALILPSAFAEKIPPNLAMKEIVVAAASSSPDPSELNKKKEKKVKGPDVVATKEDLKLSVSDFLKKYPEGKATLKNPYNKNDPKLVEEGRKIYLGYSCNGCHGGTGGGGMCPPLTNDIWVYGDDDDTLFRLIALGTDKLGRPRKRTERVKGPMPPFEELFDNTDELWKIMAFIRAAKELRDKQQ